MPSSTFYNLSEPKKKRIFDAAVDEFAQKRFSEASINQIVKSAGISRGSFYQYFAGKEDLYLYLLGVIKDEKVDAVMKESELDRDADFFSTYEHMVKHAFDWARQKPKYSQIGLLMNKDDSDFINRIKGMAGDSNTQLAELVERDKLRGLIKPEVDSSLVIDMLYGALTWFQMNEPGSGPDEDKMLGTIRKVLGIIKGGISLV